MLYLKFQVLADCEGCSHPGSCQLFFIANMTGMCSQVPLCVHSSWSATPFGLLIEFWLKYMGAVLSLT